VICFLHQSLSVANQMLGVAEGALS
jgi:hypothetical protein